MELGKTAVVIRFIEYFHVQFMYIYTFQLFGIFVLIICFSIQIKIGFAIGGEGGEGNNDGGDDEDGFSLPVATIITVVTFLIGLRIVFGTIFLAQKNAEESKDGKADTKESFLENEAASA